MSLSAFNNKVRRSNRFSANFRFFSLSKIGEFEKSVKRSKVRSIRKLTKKIEQEKKKCVENKFSEKDFLEKFVQKFWRRKKQKENRSSHPGNSNHQSREIDSTFFSRNSSNLSFSPTETEEQRCRSLRHGKWRNDQRNSSPIQGEFSSIRQFFARRILTDFLSFRYSCRVHFPRSVFIFSHFFIFTNLRETDRDVATKNRRAEFSLV